MKTVNLLLALCLSCAVAFGAEKSPKPKKAKRSVAATQKAGHAKKAAHEQKAPANLPEIPAEELPFPEPTPPLP